MKVTLDIPDSYALYFTLSSIEKEFKLYTALMLVKQGKISVSRGAEFAEMTIYDFMRECKKNDIPVIDSPARAVDAIDSLVDYANIKSGKDWTYM